MLNHKNFSSAYACKILTFETCSFSQWYLQYVTPNRVHRRHGHCNQTDQDLHSDCQGVGPVQANQPLQAIISPSIKGGNINFTRFYVG